MPISDDPDETEGRHIARARAQTRANFDVQRTRATIPQRTPTMPISEETLDEVERAARPFAQMAYSLDRGVICDVTLHDLHCLRAALARLRAERGKA